jgi:thiamine biosynthesis lipoprotein
MKFRVDPSPIGPEVAGAISGRTFSGFGTTIGSWTTNPELVDHVDGFMRNWVATVEQACSRFLPDSDISRANDSAGNTVLVSQTLLNATEAAMAMADLTNGLCDPTVGEAVINSGYDRTFTAIEADGPGPEGPSKLGGAWPQLMVDNEASTITVPAGYRLDLGGSAKGWAVDAALAALSRSLLDQSPHTGICISAGGDLAVAGRAPAGGWPVTIRERLDADAGDPGSDVFLGHGAVATSGATARRWQRGDSVGHHIIDPRTGQPGSSRWELVTVFSDRCLVSDVAATTAWLLGNDAEAWLRSLGLAARMVDRDGTTSTVGNLGDWLTGAILA